MPMIVRDRYARARNILRFPYSWLWAESDIEWAYSVMIQRYQELARPKLSLADKKEAK